MRVSSHTRASGGGATEEKKKEKASGREGSWAAVHTADRALAHVQRVPSTFPRHNPLRRPERGTRQRTKKQQLGAHNARRSPPEHRAFLTVTRRRLHCASLHLLHSAQLGEGRGVLGRLPLKCPPGAHSLLHAILCQLPLASSQ